MCRLLGFAAPAPTTSVDLIGASACADWQAMGILHDDGWGTAWLEDGHVRRVRDSAAGTDNPDLTAALTRSPARARITHLRMATEGMANQESNTHPFLADRIAFAHNGSVEPVERLRAMADPATVDRVGGTTDSAVIFALILERVRDGEPLFTSTTAVAESVRRQFPTAALNLLLLDSTQLIAVHANEGAVPPREDFEASGLGPNLPRDHRDHYFQLSWTRRPGGAFVLSSSGLDTAGWTRMTQHTAARVDLTTLEATFVPLTQTSRGPTG